MQEEDQKSPIPSGGGASNDIGAYIYSYMYILHDIQSKSSIGNSQLLLFQNFLITSDAPNVLFDS